MAYSPCDTLLQTLAQRKLDSPARSYPAYIKVNSYELLLLSPFYFFVALPSPL